MIEQARASIKELLERWRFVTYQEELIFIGAAIDYLENREKELINLLDKQIVKSKT